MVHRIYDSNIKVIGFNCCSTFDYHSRFFNNEHNSCLKWLKRPNVFFFIIWLITFHIPDVRLSTESERYLQTSDFWLLTSDFWLLTSDFWLQTSDFRLLTSDFWLRTSDFWLLTSDFWLRTSDFRLQTLDAIFHSFYFGLHTSDLSAIVI